MLFKIFLKDIDAFFSLTHEYLKEVLFIYKVLELKKRKDRINLLSRFYENSI